MEFEAVVTADIGVIRALRRALRRLERYDGVFDSDHTTVWPETDRDATLAGSSATASQQYEAARSYVTDLKNQQELLERLRIVLEARIAILGFDLEDLERLLVSKPTVERLPEVPDLPKEEPSDLSSEILREVPVNKFPNELRSEVLSLIFKHCVTDVGKDLPREQLSLGSVCRLFRTEALKTPVLWSVISSSMSMERLETQLRRSKSERLLVRISDAPVSSGNQQNSRVERVKRILLESSRWSSLKLRGNPHIISDIKPFPYLPVLRNMEITAASDNDSDFKQDFPNWTTPSLKFALADNFIPPVYFSSSLVTCDFSWHGTFSLQTRRLVYALSHIPSLQNLALTFAIAIYERPPNEKVKPPRLLLPQLQTLAVTMSGSIVQTTGLRVLSWISAPSLKTLHIQLVGPQPTTADYISNLSIYDTRKDDAIRNLLELPPSLDSLPSLEDLYFCCNYFQSKLYNCIGKLMLMMPSLRHLCFDAPYLQPPWRFHKRDVEMSKRNLTDKEVNSLLYWHDPITWFELRNCAAVKREYLIGLADHILRTPEAAENFKLLSILGCPAVSADDAHHVRTRLGGKDVFWTPVVA
ncbi:hypothetical protein DFH11DRAFT_705847 [Phellopilus nigrolimitatus]|nr:hypothetical protein DFH11DRAFT_705847 [Phellopilus nigrolimitatus]